MIICQLGASTLPWMPLTEVEGGILNEYDYSIKAHSHRDLYPVVR